ncbi:MAG: hypothetical protein ACE5KF_07045 [Kiloniellaceae bacterium]
MGVPAPSLPSLGKLGMRPALSLSKGAVILAAFLLAGCVAPPAVDGANARLFPGIEAPRARAEIDITIHEIPVTAWGKCLELIGRAHPGRALLSVLTLSPIHGCALLPRDAELKRGQRPWCIVAVPKGDAATLEHELRHCEGWAH